MYTTAAAVRLLVKDMVSGDVPDDDIEDTSDAHVVPWINAALNGGSTIATPSALVKSIDAHATACKVARSVYAKLQAEPPAAVKALCDQAKEWVKDILSGDLEDTSVTAGDGDVLIGLEPDQEFLEQSVFVGAPENWAEAVEERES